MRQVLVPAELQGRVTAAARTIGMSVMPVGGIVGGANAATVSPAWALVAAGVVGGASVVPLLTRRMVAIRVG